MKPAEAKRKLAEGRTCPCGKRATRMASGNTFSCNDCDEKDAAIYGTDRIRSTCGRPGVEAFRCVLTHHI